MHMRVTVNGVEHQFDDVPGGESLLRLLRERLGLTGPKQGCEQGRCGACTVYLDDLTAVSCLVPVACTDGRSVQTAESLAEPGPGLHAIQQAFLDAGAVQCGFCTPGMLLAAVDLLAKVPDPDDEQIRHGLAGNLCRCTGYTKIVDAVRLAARRGAA